LFEYKKKLEIDLFCSFDRQLDAEENSVLNHASHVSENVDGRLKINFTMKTYESFCF